MKTKLYNKLFVIAFVLLVLNFSCSHKSGIKTKDASTSDSVVTTTSYSTPSKYSNSDKDDDDQSTSSDEAEDKSQIEDGTYSATVDYNNPNTNYSATYTLNVEVENGQVVQIDFPNGGYLDEDHITPADLDEDGNANIEGEDGKTYDVHIEKP